MLRAFEIALSLILIFGLVPSIADAAGKDGPPMSNAPQRSRGAKPPPYTIPHRKPDPASLAADSMEALAGFPQLAVDALCAASKIAASRNLKAMRDEFPEGQLIFVVVEATVDDGAAGDMGPHTGCVMGFRIVDSGLGWPNPMSTEVMLDKVGSRRITYNTVGTGEKLENIKAATSFKIITPSPVSLNGPCEAGSISAIATLTFNGNVFEMDAASAGIEWSSSDPSGLVLTAAGVPGMRATGSKVATQTFSGRKPGSYFVVATLKRVDQALLDSLAPSPEDAKRIAEELKLTSTAVIQVNVGNAVVEPVQVKPEWVELAADQSVTFTANGLDWDVCYPTDITAKDTTVWQLANGAGRLEGTTYTPPPLKPVGLKLAPEGLSSLEVDFCTETTIQAEVQFEGALEERITASFGEQTGEAIVHLLPPPKTYTDARITWSQGPTFGHFDWGERLKPRDGVLTVTATYTDGPYTLSEDITFKVQGPNKSLYFWELPEKSAVGRFHRPEVKMSYDNQGNCMWTSTDVTREATWTVTDPDGGVKTEPGFRFEKAGPHVIRAEWHHPEGDELSVEQTVNVTKNSAKVSLSSIAPGKLPEGSQP